ncbi:uncharacterized protein LOC128095475 [Peromyscus californicus insignis]|uniref:uncharacterized protein LOC128095475 n=1 Tax=Peromyscus californicus insignis TaxID=564181 RepID=UPI0022A77643|nr:uncharacterized protein LOC128095475 [Peromyscus californicus insignis]
MSRVTVLSSMQRSCRPGHPHPALLHHCTGFKATQKPHTCHRSGGMAWPRAGGHREGCSEQENLGPDRPPGHRGDRWRQTGMQRTEKVRMPRDSLGECVSQSVGPGSSLREEVWTPASDQERLGLDPQVRGRGISLVPGRRQAQPVLNTGVAWGGCRVCRRARDQGATSPSTGPKTVLAPFRCSQCQTQGPAKPAVPVRHPRVPLPILSFPCSVSRKAQPKKGCVGRLKWENRTPQFLAQPSTSCLLAAHPCPTPLPSGACASSLSLGSPKPVAPKFHLPLSSCSLCTLSYSLDALQSICCVPGPVHGSWTDRGKK